MDNDTLSAFLLLVLILLYGAPGVMSCIALWNIARELRGQNVSGKRIFWNIIWLFGAQALLWILLWMREKLA